MNDTKVERGNAVSPYFISWDEYGTRYRLFAFPLLSFAEPVREALGVKPEAVLVTLWWGGNLVSPTAMFNAGGGPLVDAYIGEKLGIRGEDLASVGPKLRALLVRPG